MEGMFLELCLNQDTGVLSFLAETEFTF